MNKNKLISKRHLNKKCPFCKIGDLIELNIEHEGKIIKCNCCCMVVESDWDSKFKIRGNLKIKTKNWDIYVEKTDFLFKILRKDDWMFIAILRFGFHFFKRK